MNISHSRSISMFFRPTHIPSPPPWDSLYWTFCGSIPPISCVTADSWRGFSDFEGKPLRLFLGSCSNDSFHYSSERSRRMTAVSFVWDELLVKLPNFAFLCLSRFPKSSEWLLKFHLQFTIPNVANCTAKYKRARPEWNCCVLMLIRLS